MASQPNSGSPERKDAHTTADGSSSKYPFSRSKDTRTRTNVRPTRAMTIPEEEEKELVGGTPMTEAGMVLVVILLVLAGYCIYLHYSTRPPPAPPEPPKPRLTLERWVHLFMTGRVVPTGLLILTAMAGILLILHYWNRRLSAEQAHHEKMYAWTCFLILVCIIYWTYCKFIMGWAYSDKDVKKD